MLPLPVGKQKPIEWYVVDQENKPHSKALARQRQINAAFNREQTAARKADDLTKAATSRVIYFPA